MTADQPSGGGHRSETLSCRAEEAWDRFEVAWRSGKLPRIEDYLAGLAGGELTAMLRELLASEVEHRRRRGERPEPREYVDRFPEHAGLIILAFEGITASVVYPDLPEPTPGMVPPDVPTSQ